MIEIDGSEGEAGGQIIRTAIGLSAVTGKSCRIFKIRAGRPKPGLMAQHLTCVQAVAKLCNAKVSGADLWSKELVFEPGKIESGIFKFDVGTAGAISLVLQSLMIPAIHAPAKIIFDVKGGTNVSWSPTMEYFRHVFCDFMKNFGIEVKSDVLAYGFYPKGGGHVKVEVTPSKPTPIDLLERGDFRKIDVWSVASNDLKKSEVAERQIEGVKKIVELTKESKINVSYVNSLSAGSSIHVHAHYENCKIGADAIGERGKRAEQVGEDAAKLLKQQIDSNACVDHWSADQLLPFMALAAYDNEPEGQAIHPQKANSEISVAEITNHCLTNISVIEKFLPVKFEIIGKKGEPGTIICKSLK